jgi:hypothetical protein
VEIFHPEKNQLKFLKKMDETKRTFFNEEIKENGLRFIKKCLKDSNFKEISFFCK